MSIKGRIEALEKVVQAHDPKAAERQAEAVATVQRILRSPQEPSPPDADDWTLEAIQGDDALSLCKQMIVKDKGVPIWRGGDWFWPEPGSPEFQPWAGGDAVAPPAPHYFLS